MARMKEIVAAVGKDNGLTITLPPGTEIEQPFASVGSRHEVQCTLIAGRSIGAFITAPVCLG